MTLTSTGAAPRHCPACLAVADPVRARRLHRPFLAQRPAAPRLHACAPPFQGKRLCDACARALIIRRRPSRSGRRARRAGCGQARGGVAPAVVLAGPARACSRRRSELWQNGTRGRLHAPHRATIRCGPLSTTDVTLPPRGLGGKTLTLSRCHAVAVPARAARRTRRQTCRRHGLLTRQRDGRHINAPEGALDARARARAVGVAPVRGSSV